MPQFVRDEGEFTQNSSQNLLIFYQIDINKNCKAIALYAGF